MVFVDFSDAPATESPAALRGALALRATQWYSAVSYGRLSLDITAVETWFRMPKPSSQYGFTEQRPGLTFEQHRAFLADAVAASTSAVDFSQYSAVYVVASANSAIVQSPAFVAAPGTGIAADGIEIRRAVTLGLDIRNPRPDYGAFVVIHETGHLLGLPDLNQFGAPTLNAAIRHAGGWDIMSFNTPGAQFLLWHKLKLGWVEPSQVACHRLDEISSVEARLEPLDAPGGSKALVIVTGASSAYVVEVRRRAGEDARLCDEGVLVYAVDVSVPNGNGPIKVQAARSGTDPAAIDSCGPLYDAPFDLAAGEVREFRDDARRLRIELVARDGAAYVVRATRT
jgi:M6 family metalloprotease-like protein